MHTYFLKVTMEMSIRELGFLLGTLIGLVIVLLKYFKDKRKESTLTKWTALSQKKVIIHGLYGNRHLPSPSPFVLKVITFCRMAKIPYEIDKNDVWGPKGKTPWLSVNGQHISDSQFIVDFLAKKFDIQLQDGYSEKQQAIGEAVRIMCEEYMYWGGVMWRFAFGGKSTLAKVRKGEISFGEWLLFRMIAPSMKSYAWTQGIGRHSEQEILKIMEKCLRAISKILGQNTYLLGPIPCEVDCAVFAQLASCAFLQDSPFQQLLDGDCRNVKNYCYKIKEEFWPDWDNELKA